MPVVRLGVMQYRITALTPEPSVDMISTVTF